MEEYGEVYCSVEKWCTLVKLNARQRTRLRGTSLQNFLQIPSVQMRKCLLKYIIQKYDPIKKRFVLRPTKGGISLRTDDVFHILGLVNKGKDVMKALGKMDEYVKEMVPSKFVDARSGEIVIDQLINNIVSSGTYDDDFVRRAVLVLIGTIIAPHSTRHVPHFLYQLVEDVEAIKSYNWNAFTLRVCIEGITKTVKDVKKFKWAVGNLALIQVYRNFIVYYLFVFYCKINNAFHVFAVHVLGEGAANFSRNIRSFVVGVPIDGKLVRNGG